MSTNNETYARVERYYGETLQGSADLSPRPVPGQGQSESVCVVAELRAG